MALREFLAFFNCRRQLLEVQPRFSSRISAPGAADARPTAKTSERIEMECILRKCELAKCYGIAKEALGFELGKRRILERKRTQSDVYFHSDSVLPMTGEPYRRIGMISSQ